MKFKEAKTKMVKQRIWAQVEMAYVLDQGNVG